MTWISNRFMQIAVLAALCGMTLGVVMGARQEFTLAPAHAHLNLLGWVSMMVYGLLLNGAFRPPRAAGWRRPISGSRFWASSCSSPRSPSCCWDTPRR